MKKTPCEWTISWRPKYALHNYEYLKKLVGKAPRIYVDRYKGRVLAYFLIAGDISSVKQMKLRSHLESLARCERISKRELKALAAEAARLESVWCLSESGKTDRGER